MTADRGYELLLQLEDALAFLCRWAWEHGRRLTPNPGVIQKWRADWTNISSISAKARSSRYWPRRLRKPPSLFLDRLRDFPILVDLVRGSQEKLGAVAKLFDEFLGLLGLREMAALASDVKARDPWERRLQIALGDQFRSGAARLVRMALRTKSRDPAAFFRELSLDARLARFLRLRMELIEAPLLTLTPFAALAGELKHLSNNAAPRAASPDAIRLCERTDVDLERVVRLLMRREALGLLAAPLVGSISRQG